MTKALMLTTVLVMVLSIAACGGSNNQGSETPPSDVGVTTLEEDEFTLPEKRGEVVALYFMAAW